jgi:hypothetical protein
MAEVLLFHHALGQTPGFHAFADELQGVPHRAHAGLSILRSARPQRAKARNAAAEVVHCG